MSQPQTYNRQFSFSNFQAQNPSSQPPGSQIDTEFNSVKTTLDQILANLDDIQNDDTTLKNASVGVNQLSPTLTLGFSAPTSWVTNTAYTASPASTVFNGSSIYICLISHTSGVFATDLAAGKWQLILNLASIPVTAASNVTVVSDGNLVTSDVQTSLNAIDAGKAATSHTHPSTQISDSTAAGRAILTAANAGAQRALFGLGNIASENIGTGLQDDGSGNLRVVNFEVGDTNNQTVTTAFHLTQRMAANTSGVTYAFGRANTYFNGFAFFVDALFSSVTFSINAADSFFGMPSGTSLVVPQGARCYITTDGNSTGTWWAHYDNTSGFNTPLNLQLNASVSGNALTIAVKDRSGNDPSYSSPILYGLCAGAGTITPRAIAQALSITVPSGATLGTTNNGANRIWVGVFDNGGVPVLGVYNSLNATTPSILAWDETVAPSPAAISAGSTSAQTWYAGASLTTKAFRILGYVEAAQTTAGTWAASPTKVQLFGPGTKKPGDIVQTQFAAANSAAIAASSAANLIEYNATVQVSITGSPPSQATTISATSGTLQSITTSNSVGSPATLVGPVAFAGVHLPNAVTSDTYTIAGGTLSNGHIVLKELMV